MQIYAIIIVRYKNQNFAVYLAYSKDSSRSLSEIQKYSCEKQRTNPFANNHICCVILRV